MGFESLHSEFVILFFRGLAKEAFADAQAVVGRARRSARAAWLQRNGARGATRPTCRRLYSFQLQILSSIKIALLGSFNLNAFAFA
jgi:hypothetical protein